MIDFGEKVRQMLKAKGKKVLDFELDTGMTRHILYANMRRGTPHRATLMAIAYYLGTTVEDLVAGTNMEDVWSN